MGTSHQKSGQRKSGLAVPSEEQLELWLKNSPREQSRIRKLLGDFAARHHFSAKILLAIEMAVEEHFTNILSYAYNDQEEHQIRFRLALKGDLLELQIMDDGKPFNPLDHPLPNTLLPLDQKPTGGLGILMIRKMMDEVLYLRVGNRNVLTLRKQIPADQ